MTKEHVMMAPSKLAARFDLAEQPSKVTQMELLDGHQSSAT